MRPYAATTDYSQARNDSTQVPAPIHLEGWNYLFVDGHVKWLRPEKTVGTGSVTDPKGFWTVTEND